MKVTPTTIHNAENEDDTFLSDQEIDELRYELESFLATARELNMSKSAIVDFVRLMLEE